MCCLYSVCSHAGFWIFHDYVYFYFNTLIFSITHQNAEAPQEQDVYETPKNMWSFRWGEKPMQSGRTENPIHFRGPVGLRRDSNQGPTEMTSRKRNHWANLTIVYHYYLFIGNQCGNSVHNSKKGSLILFVVLFKKNYLSTKVVFYFLVCFFITKSMESHFLVLTNTIFIY